MAFVTVCSVPALSYIFMALFVNDKKLFMTSTCSYVNSCVYDG